MIRILRHISVRLWLLTLGVLPLSFWALPWLGAWFPGVPESVMVAGIFILCGLGLGFVLDIVGMKRINGLVREGELWERAGIRKRAEQKYIQAIQIFDSAWISPLAARRAKPILLKKVSGFYLTGGSDHSGFETAAALNIRANPGDETSALLWLRKLKPESQAKDLTQSVLTVLADTHYANPGFAPKLIPVFLGLGRVDFSAKRLYRNFLDNLDTDSSVPGEDGYRAGILELIGTGELDEVKVPVPETGSPVLGKTLGDLRAGAGQARTEIPIERKTKSELNGQYLSLLVRFPALVRKGLTSLVQAGTGAARVILAWLKPLGAKLRQIAGDREKLGLYIRGGLMGLLGIWLAFFVWSTVSHMLKSTDQPAHRVDIRISKPFTIQVAAYLKQSHADRYVAVLKKKGVEAFIKKTGGGGKTWYLVRISEFTDKKTAADYGNRLKNENIIEDFFVSNK